MLPAVEEIYPITVLCFRDCRCAAPPSHLQAHVDTLDEDILSRPVYLAVAVLFKFTHRDVLTVTTAAYQSSASNGAAVVVRRDQTLGTLPVQNTRKCVTIDKIKNRLIHRVTLIGYSMAFIYERLLPETLLVVVLQVKSCLLITERILPQEAIRGMVVLLVVLVLRVV